MEWVKRSAAVCFIVVAVVSLQCVRESPAIRFPDPYITTLLEQRSVHLMIGHDPSNPTICDTTIFDESARVVRRYGFGRLQEIVEYDSLGWKQRQLILNDIPSHYLYRYSLGRSHRIWIDLPRAACMSPMKNIVIPARNAGPPSINIPRAIAEKHSNLNSFCAT